MYIHKTCSRPLQEERTRTLFGFNCQNHRMICMKRGPARFFFCSTCNLTKAHGYCPCYLEVWTDYSSVKCGPSYLWWNEWFLFYRTRNEMMGFLLEHSWMCRKLLFSRYWVSAIGQALCRQWAGWQPMQRAMTQHKKVLLPCWWMWGSCWRQE